MDYILGIDIGTTGTKSALFSADGCLVDSRHISYPITYPKEGWAEQNPEDWWNALVGTVRALVTGKKDFIKVSAMSLSTQGGCLILLDDHFHPVCNAISWLDTRAEEVSDLLLEKITLEDIYTSCGWISVKGCSFPSAFWFKEKRPDLFKRARYCASTIDYINYRLTGRFSIDYTNLAMTEFLDLHKRDWSDKALQIAGITRDNVSEIVASGNIIGKLKGAVAEELGLSKNVILVSGAHDQYCANIGAGAVNNGDCVLSTGTAWVLTLTTDRLLFDKNQILHPCIHLIKNKFGLMTSVPSGGNSLNWFQSTFRPGFNFEELSKEAEKADVGSEGMIFIPQSVSQHGKASFLNIDTVHNIGHFARSIFEGVAFANRRHIEAFASCGLKINKLIMIGGGARSAVWPQIVADISGVHVIIPEQKEAACAGAAILAGVGTGIFTSIEEAAKRFIGKDIQITPTEKNSVIYEKMYNDFVNFLDYF